MTNKIKAYNLHFVSDNSIETYNTIVSLATKYFGDSLSTNFKDTFNFTEYSIYVENHTEGELEKFTEELSKFIEIREDYIDDVSF